jgi:hypothetical protein
MTLFFSLHFFCLFLTPPLDLYFLRPLCYFLFSSCVLLAYAERNSALGYCQSMNFICAILLLHMECDDVFWCLAALVEDVLPPHWFDQVRILLLTFLLTFLARYGPGLITHEDSFG